MIFNKEYDMSLLMMLASNNKSRRKIAEFIKEYPEDLIYRIHHSLEKYNDYLNENLLIMDMELTDFNGSVILDDNVSYWYCVDVFNGALELGRTSNMGEGKSDVFQLSLSMFNRDDYESNKYFQEMYLGTVTSSFVKNDVNDNKGVIDLYSTYFSVIKTPFDRVVIKSNDFSDDKNRYCSIDFSTIIEEYDNDILKNSDSLNHLVRRKKK